MRVNPGLRTVASPYEDGETLVAMPALRMDAALVHMNRADRHGNGQYLGPDPYFDDLFCEAADTAYVSCEELVEGFGDVGDAVPQTLLVQRHAVTGVVETPNGAHFTSCAPDYGRDEAFQKLYATTPWPEFAERFLPARGDEKSYQEAVRSWHAEREEHAGLAYERGHTHACARTGDGHHARNDHHPHPRRILRHRLRRRLARQRRDPGQSDGADPVRRRPSRQAHVLPRSAPHRRRGDDRGSRRGAGGLASVPCGTSPWSPAAGVT